MSIAQRFERLRALRHLKTHEDYIVQDYVRLLQHDNAMLRKQRRALKPAWLAPSGRYVLRRLVGVGALWLVLSVSAFIAQRVMEAKHELDRSAPSSAPAANKAPLTP